MAKKSGKLTQKNLYFDEKLSNKLFDCSTDMTYITAILENKLGL